jgi:hypothetical protein
MYTKDNGLMIKLKEKAYISIKMVLLILASGKTISSMDTDIKNGLMEQSMKEIL